MEWLEHRERCFFVTFTYNDENLPEGGKLEKKQFLQWLKDVQRRRTGPFRYYLVGEYGDRSKRPHYHMAVFPEHFTQVSVLRSEWSKGFTQADEINHARARYLANYTAKKLTKTGPNGLPPEFRTSSRNPPLGQAFCERIIRQFSTGAGAEIIKERGDVPRTFRISGGR